MLLEKELKRVVPQSKKFYMKDLDGLFLCVHPRGSKIWVYRYNVSGRRRQISIGEYPAMSLREARRKRDDLADKIDGGVDPLGHKRVSGRAIGDTFAEVAEEYAQIKERSGKAPVTIEKFRWYIDGHCAPVHQMGIAEVKAAHILPIIKEIAAEGKTHTAHRVRAAIGEVMRYGIATLRCESDPTPALRGALESETPQHRAAITNEDDFADLLKRIDTYGGNVGLRECLKLMALLFPRPIELRMAHRSEFDLDDAIWEVPADRMKMRRDHVVPLPRQAVELIRSIDELCIPGPYLVSAMADGRAISENGMNSALRRMGIAKDVHCSHGFRATASTILNAVGEDERYVELCLGHLIGNSVSRIYNRYKYIDERRALMQRWADRLDQLRNA